jgi:hypothetical protein
MGQEAHPLWPDPVGLEIKPTGDIRLSMELSAEQIGVLIPREQK